MIRSVVTSPQADARYSSATLARHFSTVVVFLCAAICVAQSSGLSTISTPVQSPLAVRGGVLMLPLTGEPAATWPAQITVQLNNQRTPAAIAWIGPIPETFDRHWTDDPRRLSVTTVRPSSAASPILLAPLPDDGSGEITIDFPGGTQTITPRWIDPPPGARPGRFAPRPRDHAADLPDPKSPFEHWRWLLRAWSLQTEPPAAARFDDSAADMVAQHLADLWAVGFDRLAAEDAALARQVLAALTSTASDPSAEPSARFATWVADPSRTDALLSILIQDEPVQTVASRVEAWLDALPSVLIWPEHEAVDQVRLSIVNLQDDVVAAELVWDQAIRAAVELAPMELTEVTVVRPDGARSLVLQLARESLPIGLGSDIVTVRPPGARFEQLHPALTLAEIQRAERRPVPRDRRTAVELRRLNQRWEVLCVCFRPQAPASASSVRGTRSVDDLRGKEAVTLMIESTDPTAPAFTILAVPDIGWHHIMAGRNDGTLRVHRSAEPLPDRWIVRIVLPESWISTDPDYPTHLRVARTHTGEPTLEFAPLPAAPWRTQFNLPGGGAAMDLTRWADLPAR